MDTITILGISLLFFYSLTTILQFYGIDTSIYSIYILFYIFIIVSRLILPMNYNKLFPDAEAPLTNADDVASGAFTNDVASGALTNDASSSPTIVFPPTPSQGQVTNINRASPPTPIPSTTSDTTPPKKPKNNAPSGPTDFSGLAQGFGALFSTLGALA